MLEYSLTNNIFEIIICEAWLGEILNEKKDLLFGECKIIHNRVDKISSSNSSCQCESTTKEFDTNEMEELGSLVDTVVVCCFKCIGLEMYGK